MKNMLRTLNEKAPIEFSRNADVVVSHLLSGTDVAEMRGKRGADYDTTKFYQIRVKPNDKETSLEDVLRAIAKHLNSAKSKKLGISEVDVNERSRNSGKYSSVSFNLNGLDYDVVVAAGGNAGENFEKDLLLKMDNLVAGVEDSEEARKALAALEAIDPVFKLKNIKSVVARSGSTQRSGDMSPEDTGKIIADIIIELKNKDKKYISVKNKNGSTVAQFGISKAFNDDLKVDTSSSEWKTWLAPLGLDPKKIEAGLLAAKNGTELKFADVETTEQKIRKGGPIHKIMEKMWGLNYYYLRESSGGFKALKIDKDYVANELLNGLKITEIRYPSKERKQISVYLESTTMKFKLEIRNPRGKGVVKPTQIQLIIMKGVK